MKTHLVKWDEEYRKKGLVIIDIDNGEADSMDAIKKSVEKNGVKHATARDVDAKMCNAYGVQAYAAAVLIGTDGKVVWQGFPAQNVKAKVEAIKKELEKVTKEELEKIEKESKEAEKK